MKTKNILTTKIPILNGTHTGQIAFDASLYTILYSIKTGDKIANVRLVNRDDTLEYRRIKEQIQALGTDPNNQPLIDELSAKASEMKSFQKTAILAMNSRNGKIKRSEMDFDFHTQIINIDIDKGEENTWLFEDENNMKIFKEWLINHPSVIAYWHSVSGALSYIVYAHIDKDTFEEASEYHKGIFYTILHEVRQHFPSIKIDEACHDINRKRYLNYSDEVYVNENKELTPFEYVDKDVAEYYTLYRNDKRLITSSDESIKIYLDSTHTVKYDLSSLDLDYYVEHVNKATNNGYVVRGYDELFKYIISPFASLILNEGYDFETILAKIIEINGGQGFVLSASNRQKKYYIRKYLMDYCLQNKSGTEFNINPFLNYCYSEFKIENPLTRLFIKVTDRDLYPTFKHEYEMAEAMCTNLADTINLFLNEMKRYGIPKAQILRLSNTLGVPITSEMVEVVYSDTKIKVCSKSFEAKVYPRKATERFCKYVSAKTLTLKDGDYLSSLQTDLVDIIDNNKITYIISPTGSGKTNLFLSDIVTSNPDIKIDFLVPYLTTTKMMAEKYGHPPVYEGKRITEKNIHISTYDGIEKLAYRNTSEHWLVVDEQHQLIISAQYRNNVIDRIYDLFSKYKKVILLTGTYIPISDREYPYVVDVVRAKPKKKPFKFLLTPNEKSFKLHTLTSRMHRNNLNVVYLNDKNKAIIMKRELEKSGWRVQLFNTDEKNNGIFEKILKTELIDSDVEVFIATCIFSEGLNINNKNLKSIHIISRENVYVIEQLVNRFRKKTCKNTFIYMTDLLTHPKVDFDLSKYQFNLVNATIDSLASMKTPVKIHNESKDLYFNYISKALRGINHQVSTRLKYKDINFDVFENIYAPTKIACDAITRERDFAYQNPQFLVNQLAFYNFEYHGYEVSSVQQTQQENKNLLLELKKLKVNTKKEAINFIYQACFAIDYDTSLTAINGICKNKKGKYSPLIREAATRIHQLSYYVKWEEIHDNLLNYQEKISETDKKWNEYINIVKHCYLYHYMLNDLKDQVKLSKKDKHILDTYNHFLHLVEKFHDKPYETVENICKKYHQLMLKINPNYKFNLSNFKILSILDNFFTSKKKREIIDDKKLTLKTYTWNINPSLFTKYDEKVHTITYPTNVDEILFGTP
jgi:hypothetical protein